MHVSIEGAGGVLDVCSEHRAQYVTPLVQLLHKWGRTNVPASNIPGMIDNTSKSASRPAPAPKEQPQPPAKQSEPPSVAFRAPSNPAPVAKPASNGRGATRGPKPKSHEFECPLLDCDHSLGTVTGIEDHTRRRHGGLRLTQAFSRIKQCGLCDPPRPMANVSAFTAHGRYQHGIPTALQLLSAVRRAGDPHGTLKSMDMYLMRAGHSTDNRAEPDKPAATQGDEPSRASQ
jgi:hypothetical protein